MKFIIRTLLAVLLAFSGWLWLPISVAYADQANPDSTPSVSGDQLGMNVYRNLLETGDKGVLIYANIPYAVTPGTTEDLAFMWQLLSPDGLTVLGQTTGFPYHASGYGYNAYWMYFAAADNFTWGTAYKVRLTGNPVIFTSPPTYDFTGLSYTSYTTQADNQEALADRILAISTDLYTKWSLSSATTLTRAAESGTRLSENGETFWRGVIVGCQALAPGAFEYGILTRTDTSYSGNATYADNLTNQYAGSWIDTAKQGGADFFDLDYDLLSTLLVIAACVGVMFLEQRISNNIWFGVMDAALVAVILGRQGLYDITFLCLIASLLWVYSAGRFSGVFR